MVDLREGNEKGRRRSKELGREMKGRT